MKKNILRSIVLATICLGLILSCTGCALTVYACEVIENGSLEVSTENIVADSQIIKVGPTTYNVKYDSSVKSILTDEVFDIYGVIDESSELIKSRIKVNSQTGEVYSFSNITPYQDIINIGELSDDELKAIVEQMMGDWVDFSVYNTFTVSRPHSSNSMYYLVWQVKQELMCNIKLEIYITFDGAIKSFHKTEACPSSLTKSFVTLNERDGLLETKICEYLGVESLDGIVYEIQSETLSYYNNKSAILYSVKIIDDGFEQLIALVIS